MKGKEGVVNLCVLDPGLNGHDGEPSHNLGDLIIRDAVLDEIGKVFPKASVRRLSTKEPLGPNERAVIRESDHVFVGGSNLLSSRWAIRRPGANQWAIGIRDALYLRNAILLGVGWQSYSDPLEPKAAFLLRSVLSRKAIHSVRDGYTLKMMQSTGLPNVSNTNCVTMWTLQDKPLETIPTTKADTALIMVTDYSKDVESDTAFIRLVQKEYKNVLAWPQGPGDAEYLLSIGFEGTMLPRSYDGFMDLFRDGVEFDYIGTRLHGAIRCLQNLRRALVIKVDNRAAEIGNDTGLPVVDRGDTDAIATWIQGSSPMVLRLNRAEVKAWRDQFRV